MMEFVIMQRKERKEQRRKAIYDAALHCFNMKGYYKASMDDIALAAGISKPGLYMYFKSKDKLFTELFEYIGANYFAQIRQYLEKADSPDEQLKLFGEKTCQIWNENEAFYRFALEFVSISAREPEIKQVMSRYYATSIKNFSAIIRKGIKDGKFKSVNVNKLAHLLYFMMMGQFFISQAVDQPINAAGHLNFNITTILDAVKPE